MASQPVTVLEHVLEQEEEAVPGQATKQSLAVLVSVQEEDGEEEAEELPVDDCVVFVFDGPETSPGASSITGGPTPPPPPQKIRHGIEKPKPRLGSLKSTLGITGMPQRIMNA